MKLNPVEIHNYIKKKKKVYLVYCLHFSLIICTKLNFNQMFNTVQAFLLTNKWKLTFVKIFYVSKKLTTYSAIESNL